MTSRTSRTSVASYRFHAAGQARHARRRSSNRSRHIPVHLLLHLLAALAVVLGSGALGLLLALDCHL
jgi:hypothetical protein